MSGKSINPFGRSACQIVHIKSAFIFQLSCLLAPLNCLLLSFLPLLRRNSLQGVLLMQCTLIKISQNLIHHVDFSLSLLVPYLFSSTL